MPDLPVYRANQSLQTSSGTRVDPSAAGAGGRVIQGIGKDISTFSDDLDKYEDKWDKAADVNEYTRARNERELGIADIMSRAKADPDHNNKELYEKELEDLSKSETHFRNQYTQDRHAADTAFEKGMVGIKLNELFRGKMINHQRVEIEKDGDLAKTTYLASDEIMRANVLGTYKDRLKGYMKAGFITEAEHQSELEGTKDWEYDRAMSDAGKNPQGLIDSMKTERDYNSLTPKQKADVMSTARNTIIRHKQIREMDTLKNQTVNESAFSQKMYSDEDTSIAEKILLINTLEEKGKVSGNYATLARRVLKSKEDMNVQTSAPEIAKIIRLMSDANVGYEENGNEIDYLRSIQLIRNDIMTTKGISRRDKISLQNRMDNSTQKKVAKATHDLGRSRDIRHGYGDFYKKADKFFKDAGLGHLEDEALRQFFYNTQGQELSPTQANAEMQRVAFGVVGKRRADVQEALEQSRKEFGDKAILKTLPITKGPNKGRQVVVLYRDGKPVKGTSRLVGGKRAPSSNSTKDGKAPKTKAKPDKPVKDMTKAEAEKHKKQREDKIKNMTEAEKKQEMRDRQREIHRRRMGK